MDEAPRILIYIVCKVIEKVILGKYVRDVGNNGHV